MVAKENRRRVVKAHEHRHITANNHGITHDKDSLAIIGKVYMYFSEEACYA
jgi:hypothetical protein